MTTEINLLPEAEKRPRQIKEALLSFSSNFATVLIPLLEVILLLTLAFNARAYLLVKISEQPFRNLVTEYFNKQPLETQLRNFQEKSAVLREINLERRTYSKLLNTIALLIPTSVSFSQIQVSAESIRITAQTKAIGGFATMVSNLLESKQFKEVVLTESEYLASEKYYRISLEIPLINESLFK